MKPAIFHPAALDVIRDFPDQARRDVGEAVLKLQYGAILAMPLSRPMPSVAPGVSELRVKDRAGVFRAFYFVQAQRGVLVFHAFAKKTQATPAHEIAVARRRLKELMNEII